MADYEENTVTIPTPEGVALDLVVAGLGTRFMAYAVDQAIIWLVTLALALAIFLVGDNVAGTLVFSVVIVAVFAVQIGYFIAWEVLDRGRSAGKRLAGTRVVMADGSPVTFRASAVRNLVRLVDSLPSFYGVGLVTVLVTERSQRLGDLAASTLVVRVGGASAAQPLGPRIGDQLAPWVREHAGGWDVSGVGVADIAAVRAFLDRRPGLEHQVRARLGAQFDAALRPRVPGVSPQLAPEGFLEALVWAKTGR